MIILEPNSNIDPKNSSSQPPPSLNQPGPSTTAMTQPYGRTGNETERVSNSVASAMNSPMNVPQEPPPAFAPYDASWFEVGQGDVISHDEHLNADGEALYRFLLTQAEQRPPAYRIHCKGIHTETRYRFVNHHHHHSHNHHHSHGLHHSHNHNDTETETYVEHITDFDFYIDVTPPSFSSQSTASPPTTPLDHKTRPGGHTRSQPEASSNDFAPTEWSIADNEPAYRGKVVREVQNGNNVLPNIEGLLLFSPSSMNSTSLRRATRRERKDQSRWSKQRTQTGLPPWATGVNNWNIMNAQPRDALKSSKSIRQWADEYCASSKLLKEFVYTKALYGWDISQLETVIRSTINMAHYNGNVEVTFTPIRSKIYIRPSNRLSRALSNTWLKVLSIMFLVYPFIWLFKRFHSKGGGRWEVCGSAYALKKLVPIDHSTSGDTGDTDSLSGESELPSYDDVAFPSALPSSSSPPDISLPSSSSLSPIISSTHPTSTSPTTSQVRIVQTPRGPHKLIGQREGEWFRRWESFIIRAVLTRFQSTSPLTLHSSELYARNATPGSALEGYHDNPGSTPSMPLPTGSTAHRGPGDIFLP